MENLKNIAEQLARRTVASQPAAPTIIPGCGFSQAPAEVKIVPQAFKFTSINLRMTIDTSGIDFTQCAINVGAWDETGVQIPTTCALSAYDLTDPAGQALALSEIICLIDEVYGTTAAGTLTVVPGVGLGSYLLTIDITGAINVVPPVSVLSFVLYDVLASSPIPFATYPA